MYIPKSFVESDDNKIKKLIQDNSLATILSFPKDEYPFISHLPLIVEGDKTLLGHMSRGNPQWRHFKENAKSIVIIHGPDSYISPSWYKKEIDVPTWNYVVAHLYGKIELVESFDEQVEILKEQAAYFERDIKNPWQFELPPDMNDSSWLTNAIISFKFHIEKIEAKSKLSQNRHTDDQQGVLAALKEKGDDKSLGLRELMMDYHEKNIKRN